MRRKPHLHRRVNNNINNSVIAEFKACRVETKRPFWRNQDSYLYLSRWASRDIPRISDRNPASTVAKHSTPRIAPTSNASYITDFSDICEMFALYFSSVFTGYGTCTPALESDGAHSLMQPRVIIEDVTDAIHHLLSKTSCGADGISPFIIKGCCNVLAPLLLEIFI